MNKEDKIRIIQKISCLDQHHLNMVFLTTALTFFETTNTDKDFEDIIDKFLKEQEQ